MPEKKGNTSYFIKDEISVPVKGGEISNYTGVGVKYTEPNFGNIEGMAAFKISESKTGGFGEIKYTTPKLVENWSIESRTRVCGDYKSDDSLETSLTQRIAAKASWYIGNGLSIYEIAGVNSKISLQGDGIKSITPTSITGLGYKNMYCEFGLSKGYNLQTKQWSKITPEVYLGYKVTF